MARIGIVSYNRYGNFTNYGSALQSWAMCRAVDKLGAQSVLVDYLPEVLRDKNPLNPMAHMWDTDPVARRQWGKLSKVSALFCRAVSQYSLPLHRPKLCQLSYGRGVAGLFVRQRHHFLHG